MDRIKVFIYRLLRKSEKYIKTDMIYATRSGFWLMIAQVFGAVISLVISILFAHYLPKETFGVYRYILSIAGVAGAFSLTGMNTAVTRAVAQGFDGVFKAAIYEQLKWSSIQFIFLCSSAVYYFSQSNNVYGIAFLIISILAPLSSITNTYNAYLHGKKDFKTSTLYGIFSNIAYVGGMALIIYYSPKILFLVVGYYVINTAINTYFFFKTKEKYQMWNSTQYRSEDISYGKHLSLMNIINTLATQADNILVYHLLGPASLALYTFATIIPDRIRVLFGLIATAAFPKMVNKDLSEGKKGIGKKTLQLLALSILVLIVYTLCAPLLFKVLFPQYLDSVLYSQVFSISLIAIATNIPLTMLFAQRFQKELYIINVATPILKIIITVVSIWYIGIWGAIISRIAGHVITLIFSSFYLFSHKPHESTN